MPVSSSKHDIEALQMRSSDFAAEGVTFSLAATAAAVLRAEPARELTPRLRRSLEAARSKFARVERYAEDGSAAILFQRTMTSPYPDRLIAQLAVGDDDQDADRAVDALRDAMTQVLAMIDELMSSPTVETAGKLEGIFARLSDAASDFAEVDGGEVLEVELAVRPTFAA